MKGFVVRWRVVLAISILGFILVAGCNSDDKRSANLDLSSAEAERDADPATNAGQPLSDQKDKQADGKESPVVDQKPSLPSPPKMANSRIIALPPTNGTTADPSAFSVNERATTETIEFPIDVEPSEFAVETTRSESPVISSFQTTDDGRTQVEVFYATDRASKDASVRGEFPRVFMWPLLAILVTGLFAFLDSLPDGGYSLRFRWVC